MWKLPTQSSQSLLDAQNEAAHLKQENEDLKKQLAAMKAELEDKREAERHESMEHVQRLLEQSKVEAVSCPQESTPALVQKTPTRMSGNMRITNRSDLGRDGSSSTSSSNPMVPVPDAQKD